MSARKQTGFNFDDGGSDGGSNSSGDDAPKEAKADMIDTTQTKPQAEPEVKPIEVIEPPVVDTPETSLTDPTIALAPRSRVAPLADIEDEIPEPAAKRVDIDFS